MKRLYIVFGLMIVGNLYSVPEKINDILKNVDFVKIAKNSELIEGKTLDELEVLRKKNLEAQIKEKGLSELISDYEGKIQNFKKEDMYFEYPELMAEYHHNLFELYIRKLDNFVKGKGKTLLELKNELLLRTIYTKLLENLNAATLNYKKVCIRITKVKR